MYYVEQPILSCLVYINILAFTRICTSNASICQHLILYGEHLGLLFYTLSVFLFL
jgi:hypothetical protein